MSSTSTVTADFHPFDMAFIGAVTTRIINKVKGVNRVVYDVTSKPPGSDWGGSDRLRLRDEYVFGRRTLKFYRYFSISWSYTPIAYCV